MNSQRHTLQKHCVQLALAYPWTHLITINFNCFLSIDSAKQILRIWAMNTGSRLLRAVRDRPSLQGDAFAFFAFWELTEKGHPHFHVALRTPNIDTKYLTHVSQSRLRAQCSSGTVDVQRIVNSDADRLRIANYVCKELDENVDHLVTSLDLELPPCFHGHGEVSLKSVIRNFDSESGMQNSPLVLGETYLIRNAEYAHHWINRALTTPPGCPDAFSELKKHIDENGQYDPIVIFENQILDGTYRHDACAELGLPVKVKIIEGTFAKAVSEYISRNLVGRCGSAWKLLGFSYNGNYRDFQAQVRAVALKGAPEAQRRLLSAVDPQGGLF